MSLPARVASALREAFSARARVWAEISLESVASADLVPQATIDILVNAYRGYRERTHHLSLEARETVVSGEEFRDVRAAVTAIWNATLVA